MTNRVHYASLAADMPTAINLLSTFTVIKGIKNIKAMKRRRCPRPLDQSSSMSIAMLPSGLPSAAWLPLRIPPTPTALPAMRLRLRTYSLCLACFFALIKTSLPRLALFAPAYERLVAVPMLDRTRGGRTALPLARGILEPPAERDNVDEDAEE